MVRVSGLDDMTIDVTTDMLTEPWTSREDANDTFCVYSNDGADGAYKMTVTATPGVGDDSTPFDLTGTGGKLGYAIWTSDDTGNAFKGYTWNGNVQSYKSNGDSNGRRTTLDCGVQGDNANIHVGVNDTDIIAAQAGTYSDTVTVTVSVI